MRVLVFRVDGQSLRKEGDFDGITAKSKGYLKCRFVTEDTDWSGAKKVAIFADSEMEAVNGSGECMVPDAVTDGKSFKVQLAGEVSGQSGKMRMLTNPVLVEQVV